MSYSKQLLCGNQTTNHEGAVSWRMSPEWELYTAVVTMMGVEDKFYEKGNARVQRVADLVRKADPDFTARLAVYAREEMHLRSVPLLLLVELAQCHRGDSLVSCAVSRTVQRADEITELLMCYQWRSGRKGLRRLSSQLRKGLAEAFNRFDEYQFAKYNRKERAVTLRDALLLVHPRPKDDAQAELFRKILDGTLETPYTWETELSAVGQQRKETEESLAEAKRGAWRQLVESRRMGYMATLRNLHNMLKLNLDDESMQTVCDYLANPEAVRKSKQLPFRFLSAYIRLVGSEPPLGQSMFIPSRPLMRVLDGMRRKSQVLQDTLSNWRQGYFHVCVPKVSRRQKKHFRTRRWELRWYEQLSKSQLLRIRKLEKLLARLSKREKKLEEYLGRSNEERMIRKYGESGRAVLQALEAAVRHTAMNLSGFGEETRVLIASDVSGSMYRPVSQKSAVMCFHIGLLLSMLMRYRCRSVVTGMFGDTWKVFDMPEGNILRNTVEMISREGEVGYSTNGYKVIDWLVEEKRVTDKVMLFTDCQLWNSECGESDLSQSWAVYKEIAPEARLYIFDLAGYGQSPVCMERDDVFCIAGWSDKVFDILAALEQGGNAIDTIRQIDL